MKDEYSGATLSGRAGIIIIDSSRTSQVQSAVLKVYEGRWLAKYSRSDDHKSIKDGCQVNHFSILQLEAQGL